MKELKGHKYRVYVGNRELEDVVTIRIDDDWVHVDSCVSYKTFNGSDYMCIGTSTYNKDEITIIRREECEL